MDIIAYQKATDVFTAVAIASFLILALTIFIRIGSCDRRTDNFMKVVQFILCITLFVTGCMLLYRSCRLDNARKEANYTVYLDGEKVDETKIDITLYRRSYNDEKKEVYITRGGRR